MVSVYDEKKDVVDFANIQRWFTNYEPVINAMIQFLANRCKLAPNLAIKIVDSII